MKTTPLRVAQGDLVLSGSVWAPASMPRALVVTYPGSGPSDRDNDGYFVPIRSLLIEAGCVVAGFDKRGVGGSTGDWRDASIERQADDLLAVVANLRQDSLLARLPLGLFGHSQGGWVVIEASSRSDAVEFLIVNSGPGVTPGGQERFAARRALEANGGDTSDLEKGLRAYDDMVQLARAGAALSEVGPEGARFLPDPTDEEAWRFWTAIVDYDPRPPLASLGIPLLALYGAEDPLVPIGETIAVLRSIIPSDRLTVEVFPGAGHRIQVGEPPRLPLGYGERVVSFLEDRVFQS